MSSNLRAGILAFLTAGITLFVQILVHRMISVKLLNNYAFLVISLTCSGLPSQGWLSADGWRDFWTIWKTP